MQAITLTAIIHRDEDMFVAGLSLAFQVLTRMPNNNITVPNTSARLKGSPRKAIAIAAVKTGESNWIAAAWSKLRSFKIAL